MNTPNGPNAFFKSSSTVAPTLIDCAYDISYQEMVDFDQDDDLSRFIDNKRSPNEETVVAFVSVERDIQHALVESIRNTSVSAEGVRKEMALKFFSPNGLLFHQKMIYLGFTVIEIH
ncbi:unnamed protein product [Hymenolepis diminuta]|uniref:Spt5-NGN domain-containing protein n=1 Tax=Hymenolepis diminuta TaxID=6216 RepID=A0A0R3SQY4_HYMDI|nr:unnamed protein product [Hymenolepis diminuta]